MNVTVIAGRDLGAALAGIWSDVQAANVDLASPYFAPEFTEAVAAVRDDVEVAVVSDAGRIVAFLPFQRSRKSVGIPVGGILSDYQGLICAPGLVCEPRELIRHCRLVAWDFDHLIASQQSFVPFHRSRDISPVIDLSQGFGAYAAACHVVKKMQQMVRRIEREVGPLRFIPQSTDAAHFAQTLAWKSQQYLASGKPDLLATAWMRAVLERLLATDAAGCGGILSLLHAGDRLVAGHFGLRSRRVWHYWFPAYDDALSKYSPGLILLMMMAERAESLGLRIIDLGGGRSLYKQRFMTGSVAVAAGSVELPSLLSMRRAARRRLRTLVERSPLATPARRLLRRLR